MDVEATATAVVAQEGSRRCRRNNTWGDARGKPKLLGPGPRSSRVDADDIT